MANAKLRAWWAHRQGLDGSLMGHSAGEVLERTGWARSVAGAGPYLTLFARAGLSRAEIDAAVADLSIHELPAARGCTYVLPAADYSLGLTVGQSFTENETRVALKLGVTADELAKLRTAIPQALANGPLEPDAIRAAVGPAARSLGPEGVKKGIATTLPVALGTMQSAGEIRRISTNGRFDNQRYKYALWGQEPLHATPFETLARRYFGWTGGASLSEFQWFSGLSAKAAKAAVEPLKLERLADDGLILPEDRAAFETFQPPKHPQYAVVSSLDGLNQLRRELKSLVAPEDEERVGLRNQKSVADLSNHAIFDRGRLIGLWAFDTETGTIAWNSFIPPDRALKDAIAKTEAFVRDELGDARSFSLDSPKSRAPRIAELRKAAGA